MKHDFDSALDECLTELQARGDLEVCLARHRRYRDELRPLLELAVAVQGISIPEPLAPVRAAGRRRLLEAVARRERARRPRSIPNSDASRPWRAIQGRLAWLTSGGLVRPLALAAMASVIAISTITTYSSASLPGDTLYPVKLGMRETRLILTFNPDTRQQLENEFDTQQREEVHSAMQDWRRARVKFKGHLRQIEPGTWVVDELPVSLDPETAIVGQPRPGSEVAVQGYLPGDGSLVAISLAVEEPKQMSSGGQPSPTVTSPLAQPSAQSTRSQAVDTTPMATFVLSPTHEPTLTCTLAPSATPSITPSRTARPRPSGTAVPSDTPAPSPSPGTGGGHVKPSVTPVPTSLPSPTSVLSPTQPPTPTDIVTPTGTPPSTPGTLITPDLTATSAAIASTSPTPVETSTPVETPVAADWTPTPDETPTPTDWTPTPDEIAAATQTPEPGGTR